MYPYQEVNSDIEIRQYLLVMTVADAPLQRVIFSWSTPAVLFKMSTSYQMIVPPMSFGAVH